MAKQSGTKFQVNLGAIKLPADAEKRIASEIRQVVLKEMAKLDLNRNLIFNPRWRLGPGIYGLIIDIERFARSGR